MTGDSYTENLKNKGKSDFDIVKVYDNLSVCGFNTFYDMLKLIWQRPAEKTPEQLKIEELEKTIESLKKDGDHINATIKEAQRQIQELRGSGQ